MEKGGVQVVGGCASLPTRSHALRSVPGSPRTCLNAAFARSAIWGAPTVMSRAESAESLPRLGGNVGIRGS